MTTKIGRNARLLALLALVAVLPLGIWACDAGDAPDGPTGPSSIYNPDMDYPGAKITAKANPEGVAPGETFTILAYFADGNGRPVQGIPLKVWAESSDNSSSLFSFQTNPTLTSSNGRASINVVTSASCPEGSYTFVIAPVAGPNVRGYTGVQVGGTSTVEAVTGFILTTLEPTINVGEAASFTMTATATPACDLWIVYQAMGAGASASANVNATSGLPVAVTTTNTTSEGSVTVTATAYCDNSPADPLSPLTREILIKVDPAPGP